MSDKKISSDDSPNNLLMFDDRGPGQLKKRNKKKRHTTPNEETVQGPMTMGGVDGSMGIPSQLPFQMGTSSIPSQIGGSGTSFLQQPLGTSVQYPQQSLGMSQYPQQLIGMTQYHQQQPVGMTQCPQQPIGMTQCPQQPIGMTQFLQQQQMGTGQIPQTMGLSPFRQETMGMTQFPQYSMGTPQFPQYSMGESLYQQPSIGNCQFQYPPVGGVSPFQQNPMIGGFFNQRASQMGMAGHSYFSQPPYQLHEQVFQINHQFELRFQEMRQELMSLQNRIKMQSEVVPQSPSTTGGNEIVFQAQSSAGFKQHRGHHKKSSDKASKKMKKGKKLTKQSCKPTGMFELSSESEDSDGDKEEPSTSKRGRLNNHQCDAVVTNFVNPTVNNTDGQGSGSSSHQSDNLVVMTDTQLNYDNNDGLGKFREEVKLYQAGRKNTVWQDLADEEHLKEASDKMDMITMIDKFVINRGPESYIVGNKRKRKRPEDIRKEADLAAEESEGEYGTDSTVSSCCFSDSTKAHVKERIKMKKTVKKISDKGSQTGQKMMEEKVKKIDDSSLPYFIGKTLREEKYKWHLFVRAMKVFGREFMINLFLKTLKVERLGGILTKNKKRRRTPGGVFLYMLRTDERQSQSDRDVVFEYDQHQALEAKRIDKSYQKKKMFESMSLRLAGVEEFDGEDEGKPSQISQLDTDASSQAHLLDWIFD